MGSALLASMVLYLKLKNIPVVTIINRLVTPLTSPFPISIVHNLFVALTITNHNGACCITKNFNFYERNSCTDSNLIWLLRSPLPLISDLRNSLSNICSAHSYYFSGNRDRRGVPSFLVKPFFKLASLQKIWLYEQLAGRNSPHCPHFVKCE